jgi:hypothetical protein
VCLLVLACIFRGALLTYSSVKDIRGLASLSALCTLSRKREDINKVYRGRKFSCAVRVVRWRHLIPITIAFCSQPGLYAAVPSFAKHQYARPT